MGTIALFRDKRRAAYIALKLKEVGFGVLWRPDDPRCVATVIGPRTFARFCKEHCGLADPPNKAIDVGTKAQLTEEDEW